MTAYTCKRLCCSVVMESRGSTKPTDIWLNGERVTTGELADRAGLSHQGVRRRLSAYGCLVIARQPGNRRAKAPPMTLVRMTSDSDRLAARFLKLPRIAA